MCSARLLRKVTCQMTATRSGAQTKHKSWGIFAQKIDDFLVKRRNNIFLFPFKNFLSFSNLEIISIIKCLNSLANFQFQRCIPASAENWNSMKVKNKHSFRRGYLASVSIKSPRRKVCQQKSWKVLLFYLYNKISQLLQYYFTFSVWFNNRIW